MESEIQTLNENATWHLVPAHGRENVIASKWVYKIKRKVDDVIESSQK
jgi:hypothetical protein